jgi:hypothetical protein
MNGSTNGSPMMEQQIRVLIAEDHLIARVA